MSQTTSAVARKGRPAIGLSQPKETEQPAQAEAEASEAEQQEDESEDDTGVAVTIDEGERDATRSIGNAVRLAQLERAESIIGDVGMAAELLIHGVTVVNRIGSMLGDDTVRAFGSAIATAHTLTALLRRDLDEAKQQYEADNEPG